MSNNFNPYGLAAVGLRFVPTDEELVAYYLLRKILGVPIPEPFVLECDLYGEENPWELWQRLNDRIIFNPSDGSQNLYFFTRLKRKKPTAVRVERRVGIGAWQGEDAKSSIMASTAFNVCIGFKKRFRFEKSGTYHDGEWIMHEYSLDASLLPPNIPNSIVNELVLCRIRKNEHVSTSQNCKNDNKRKKPSEHNEVDQSQYKVKRSKHEDLEPFQNHSRTDNTIFNIQELFPKDPSSSGDILNNIESGQMELIGLTENGLYTPEVEREITLFDQEMNQSELSENLKKIDEKTCTQEDDFEILINIDELLNQSEDLFEEYFSQQT